MMLTGEPPKWVGLRASISGCSSASMITESPILISAWPILSPGDGRSEEHTSELQSLTNLVCRLLLEKKKKSRRPPATPPYATPTLRLPRRQCPNECDS